MTRDEMAWPREENEGAAEPKVPPPSTREAEAAVQRALEDRAPHVSILRDEDEDDAEAERVAEYERRRLRQREADPVFILMILIAVSIGITPMEGVIRYVILWMLMGGAGLLAYALGSGERMTETTAEDIRTGAYFGLGMSLPFILLFGSAFKSIITRMFVVDNVPTEVMQTWVFMAVVFVQPATDSLFFRGAMQQFRNLFLTAILATVWTVLFYFPHMELSDAPGVATMIGILFGLQNFMYSYVRYRNGLAAAWVCQTIAGGMLWFVPLLLF
ncbi:MAG: CPBP family intramembrane metalloprotease [Anaerolineales bacterium]|nr:CPBP family intramembrane metalloprotease [Anaerolineales bacterium]